MSGAVGLVSVREVAEALRMDQREVRAAIDALGVPLAVAPAAPEPSILVGLVPLCLAIPQERWQRAHVDHAIDRMAAAGVDAASLARRLRGEGHLHVPLIGCADSGFVP